MQSGARRARGLVRGGEVAAGDRDPALVAEQRLADEGGGAAARARRGELAAQRRHVGGAVVAEAAAVGVGQLGDVDVRRQELAPVRAVDAVRAQLVGRGGPAVVGALERDDVVAAGGDPGEAEREVDGLAAGVDEEDPVERGGKQRGEPLRVLRHHAVEEARVRVEQPELAVRGRGDGRVGVADDGDVVDRVDVRAAVRVVEDVAGAADELRRVVVVEALGRGDGALAAARAARACGRRGRARRRRRGARDGSGHRPSHASRSRGVAEAGEVGRGGELDVDGGPSPRGQRPTSAPAATRVARGDGGREPGEPDVGRLGLEGEHDHAARRRPRRGPASGARTGVPGGHVDIGAEVQRRPAARSRAAPGRAAPRPTGRRDGPARRRRGRAACRARSRSRRRRRAARRPRRPGRRRRRAAARRAPRRRATARGRRPRGRRRSRPRDGPPPRRGRSPSRRRSSSRCARSRGRAAPGASRRARRPRRGRGRAARRPPPRPR